jgi:hypothetical protein
MPAFGYILLLNNNVHQYLTLKFDGWLLHYLPSIWRVWLLFYSTFSLAIGSLIFSVFALFKSSEMIPHLSWQMRSAPIATGVGKLRTFGKNVSFSRSACPGGRPQFLRNWVDQNY